MKTRQSHVKTFREPIILEAHFEPLGIQDATGGHDTHLYQIKSPESLAALDAKNEIWFIKRTYNNDEPLELEIIAGELYRLLLGKIQTRTRFIIDKKGNKNIGSEGVVGFINLANTNLTDYFNFARILYSSMLLAETDLKKDNIGLNSQGETVKIDHDSSLWPIVVNVLKYDTSTDTNCVVFTHEDLDNILGTPPDNKNPPNYRVSAWAGGLPPEQKKIIASNPEFQHGAGFQLLKMLTCPVQLRLAFILHNSYASDEEITEQRSTKRSMQNEVLTFVTSRIKILREESLKSTLFNDYIKKHLTRDDIDLIFQEYIDIAKQDIYFYPNNEEQQKLAIFFKKIYPEILLKLEKSLQETPQSTESKLDRVIEFMEESFCQVNEICRSSVHINDLVS